MNLEERNIDRFIERIQEKLDNNEMLKEKIQVNYPEMYDILQNRDRLLNFPIFCIISFITILTIIILLWDTFFWVTQGQLLVGLWYVICVPLQ